jgi:hypothetical protein
MTVVVHFRVRETRLSCGWLGTYPCWSSRIQNRLSTYAVEYCARRLRRKRVVQLPSITSIFIMKPHTTHEHCSRLASPRHHRSYLKFILAILSNTAAVISQSPGQTGWVALPKGSDGNSHTFADFLQVECSISIVLMPNFLLFPKQSSAPCRLVSIAPSKKRERESQID